MSNSVILTKNQIFPLINGELVEKAAVFSGKYETVSAPNADRAISKIAKENEKKNVSTAIKLDEGRYLVFSTSLEYLQSARGLLTKAELYPAEAAAYVELSKQDLMLPAVIVENIGEKLLMIAFDKNGVPVNSLVTDTINSVFLRRFLTSCQDLHSLNARTIIFTFDAGELGEIKEIEDAEQVHIGSSVVLQGLEGIDQDFQLLLPQEKAEREKRKIKEKQKKKFNISLLFAIVLSCLAILLWFNNAGIKNSITSYQEKLNRINLIVQNKRAKLLWNKIENTNYDYATPFSIFSRNMPIGWTFTNVEGSKGILKLVFGPYGKDILPTDRLILINALNSVGLKYSLLPTEAGYVATFKCKRLKESM
jgi:hypothetical protein